MGNLNLVKELLKIPKIDLVRRGVVGSMAICALGNHYDRAFFILDEERETTLKHPNWNKTTPLIMALCSSSPEVLKVLLDLGEDINGVNHFGKTALMMAADRNKIEHFEMLLKHGADIWVETPTGLRVSYMAESKPQIKALLEKHIEESAAPYVLK